MTTATAPTSQPSKFQQFWNKAFGLLQKMGKSLMLPVSVLPVAGILLGLGSARLIRPLAKLVLEGGCAMEASQNQVVLSS
jgi:phosphotransferase system  glucose/maltose/N-acetylglucosamine-specific IIC component